MGKVVSILLIIFYFTFADIIRVEPGGDSDCSDGLCGLRDALILAVNFS